jgi:RNA-directed DNA polymerase
MKRANSLMDKIIENDNLNLAFWKARKAKDGLDYVEKYRQYLAYNLNKLSQEIKNGKVIVGDYSYFKVFDPKERLICAARFSERVLHHALMNVCHPYFEKYQIYDSYASRINKGTYAAIERAAYYQNTHQSFLKLDIRKYFDSIDHNVLICYLEKMFKEKKLHTLFSDIIGSYYIQSGKGLPIGNLTSQYFANHYLAISDHFVKEQLKIKAYVRYMDDMVLWGNDKTELIEKGKQLEQFLDEKLKLNLKIFCVNKTQFGLSFLGYVLFKNKIHLNKNSRKRFRTKLKEYEHQLTQNKWTQSEYQKHLLPLLAFAQKADSSAYRKQCIMQTIKDDN